MNELIVGVVCSIICIFLGTWQGDQTTLLNCATKFEAKMLGGGVIECTVRKESK